MNFEEVKLIASNSTVILFRLPPPPPPKVTHAAKKVAFKSHHENIIRGENHLYRIILLYSASITALKQEDTFRCPDIEF